MKSITSKAQKQKQKSEHFPLLPARFDSQCVSSVASFAYIEHFKHLLDIFKLYRTHISYVKGSNSIYPTERVVDYMVDGLMLGNLRFTHLDELREDPGYQKIKGCDRVPSEKVARELLSGMSQNFDQHRQEILAMNRELLKKQAILEGPRDVCIDGDDTVVTIFGKQAGSGVGYNPRYHGRPSYKEKVAILSGSREIIDLTLEDGRHHSNNGFLAFYEECKAQLPASWIIKRIRLDKGFCDVDNFNAFESDQVEYVVKAKKQARVNQVIDYVINNPEDFPFTILDKIYAVADITVPLPGWDKARRFIIIRKKLKQIPDEQQVLDEWFRYEYQAIITNIDYLSAGEIFEDYNQRCDIENRIDDLKQGFGFDQNSQQDRNCNELFLLFKAFAHNLLNFFRRIVLPEEMQSYEVNTLRRLFLRVSATIQGNGWYQHIRYGANRLLEACIPKIRDKLIQLCLI